MMTNNSLRISVSRSNRNNTPTNGTSAKNGTRRLIAVRVFWIKPPNTTVWPLYAATVLCAVVRLMLLMITTVPSPAGIGVPSVSSTSERSASMSITINPSAPTRGRTRKINPVGMSSVTIWVPATPLLITSVIRATWAPT